MAVHEEQLADEELGAARLQQLDGVERDAEAAVAVESGDGSGSGFWSRRQSPWREAGEQRRLWEAGERLRPPGREVRAAPVALEGDGRGAPAAVEKASERRRRWRRQEGGRRAVAATAMESEQSEFSLGWKEKASGESVRAIERSRSGTSAALEG